MNVEASTAAGISRPSGERPTSQVLARLGPFLRPYSGRIAIAMLCLLTAKVAGLAVPMLLKRLIDTLGIKPTIAVIPVALLQAFLSVTLRANQIVTGIGINILVLGATTTAYRAILGRHNRTPIPGLDRWSPPGLGDIPVYGEAIFRQTWLLYAALVVIAIVAWVLRHTAIGLAVRAAGTEPRAVDKSGLSVARVRYGAVLFTGFMSALAGCFLSIGDIHTFTDGMTNGAGYLALAAVIFGNWRIGRTVLASLFFGAATALQFQLPATGVNVPTALLIMLPYLMALIAVGGLVGRQTAPPYLTQAYVR